MDGWMDGRVITLKLSRTASNVMAVYQLCKAYILKKTFFRYWLRKYRLEKIGLVWFGLFIEQHIHYLWII